MFRALSRVMEVDIGAGGRRGNGIRRRPQSSLFEWRRREQTGEASGCEGRAADAFEPAFGEMGRDWAQKRGDAMRSIGDSEGCAMMTVCGGACAVGEAGRG